MPPGTVLRGLHQLTWNATKVFLSIPAAIRILKWVYVGMHFAVLNPMLGRIAVGLYTLSLLGKNSRAVRYTIWFLMFQQLVHNIGIAAVLLHVCGTDPKEIAKYASTHIMTADGQSLTSTFQPDHYLLQAVTLVTLCRIRRW